MQSGATNPVRIHYTITRLNGQPVLVGPPVPTDELISVAGGPSPQGGLALPTASWHPADNAPGTSFGMLFLHPWRSVTVCDRRYCVSGFVMTGCKRHVCVDLLGTACLWPYVGTM